MHIEALFTPTQQALVAGLHRRDQQERQAGAMDPLRLRAVSPQVAHYLCLTAIHQQARTLVEFGTSHGYSTLHLAAAAQRTGGRVYSLDRMPEKTTAAQANLRQAGLDHLVECYTGEGRCLYRGPPRARGFCLCRFRPARFCAHVHHAGKPSGARGVPLC